MQVTELKELRTWLQENKVEITALEKAKRELEEQCTALLTRIQELEKLADRGQGENLRPLFDKQVTEIKSLQIKVRELSEDKAVALKKVQDLSWAPPSGLDDEEKKFWKK